MNELIQITYNENNEPVVSGRELHEKLEVKTAYKDWFPRMCEYGFEEGNDFCSFLSESTGGRPSTDHILTLDMAKQLCMIQRSDKGREFREYFIEVEKAWNSPEKIMARALKVAERTIANLEADVAKKSVELAIAQLKVEYFNELVDRNLLTNFRETAKELKVAEKKFVAFLIEHKFVYRDKTGKLCPKADKNDGLFEVKECFNEKTGWRGTQTLVTPKGRETFRLICQGV